MEKLQSLKIHLLNKIAKLSPQQVHVFAEDGTIKGGLKGSLSFAYHYKATIIIEGLSANADDVFVPLLIWCQYNQTDLQDENIRFIADPLDNGSVDLRIELPLDERVLVTQKENGNYTTDHPAEPQPEYNQDSPGNFQKVESDKD